MDSSRHQGGVWLWLGIRVKAPGSGWFCHCGSLRKGRGEWGVLASPSCFSWVLPRRRLLMFWSLLESSRLSTALACRFKSRRILVSDVLSILLRQPHGFLFLALITPRADIAGAIVDKIVPVMQRTSGVDRVDSGLELSNSQNSQPEQGKPFPHPSLGSSTTKFRIKKAEIQEESRSRLMKGSKPSSDVAQPCAISNGPRECRRDRSRACNYVHGEPRIFLETGC